LFPGENPGDHPGGIVVLKDAYRPKPSIRFHAAFGRYRSHRRRYTPRRSNPTIPPLVTYISACGVASPPGESKVPGAYHGTKSAATRIPAHRND